MTQGFEVKRQSPRRYLQQVTQRAGRQTLCARHNYGTEGPQTLSLRQDGQGFHRPLSCFF